MEVISRRGAQGAELNGLYYGGYFTQRSTGRRVEWVVLRRLFHAEGAEGAELNGLYYGGYFTQRSTVRRVEWVVLRRLFHAEEQRAQS